MSKSLLAPFQPQQTIHVYGDENYEFRRQPKDSRPHTRMPPIRNGKTPNRKPDLLDLLGDLSKGARDLFLEIKRNMNFVTYLATLPNQGLSQSKLNNRTKAIQELERTGNGLAFRVPTSGLKNVAGLELRLKPSTFILSPEYLFPNPDHEEEMTYIWNQCKLRRQVKSKSLAKP
jgi:hypothetical protein